MKCHHIFSVFYLNAIIFHLLSHTYLKAYTHLLECVHIYVLEKVKILQFWNVVKKFGLSYSKLACLFSTYYLLLTQLFAKKFNGSFLVFFSILCTLQKLR